MKSRELTKILFPEKEEVSHVFQPRESARTDPIDVVQKLGPASTSKAFEAGAGQLLRHIRLS
jgi:hypothetical protein